MGMGSSKLLTLSQTPRGRGGVAPVLRGIEGLWLLDEGSGVTAADSGGGGHDMAIAAPQAPDWESTGLNFVDDKFGFISGWSPNLTSGYTFSCVFQCDLTQVDCGYIMLADAADKAGMWASGASVLEAYSTGTGAGFRIYHNKKTSVIASVFADVDLTDGDWHVLTFKHDGGTALSVYLDGGHVTGSPAVFAAISSSTDDTALGLGRTSRELNGSSGIFKLHSVALTDDELAQDLAYFSAVMGGRGVTLPFDPLLVANTSVACLYDTGITRVPGSFRVSNWNSGKGSLDNANQVLSAYIAPSADGSSVFDGFVFGGASGMRTQTMNLGQPFTIYALVLAPFGFLASKEFAPIASYDGASDDVSLFIKQSTGKVGAISGGNTTVPDSEIEGGDYTSREWVRVRAVFNGSDSLVQIEDDTTTGTLDSNNVGGYFKAAADDVFVAHWQLISGIVSDADNGQMWRYLDRTKALLPVYSSTVVAPSDSKYRAFPGVAVDTSLTPDNIIAVFRHGTDHATTLDGVIKLTKSTDDGDTWSAEETIYTPAADIDARDPRITVTSANRWIVSFFDYDGDFAVAVKTMYSDNQGGAWSSPVTLSPTTPMDSLACSGYVTELASGDFLMPTYGFTTAPGYAIGVIFRSTDNGASWSEDSTISISGSKDVNEPNLLLLADGTLLMFIRCTDSYTYRAVATDSTATPIVWSTPVSVVRGFAAPGVCELSDGTVLLCTRNGDYYDETGKRPMCIYTSGDEGETWSNPISPEPWIANMEYGSPIEYDGKPCLFWAQEGATMLFWRDLSDVIS